jgi:hypothetical protein
MLRGLQFHFVERMEEVLPLALCEGKPKKPGPRTKAKAKAKKRAAATAR